MIQQINNFFFYFTLQESKIEHHTIFGRGSPEGDSQAICVSVEGLTLSMIVHNIMGSIKFKVFRHKHTHSITKIIKNSAVCKSARPLLHCSSVSLYSNKRAVITQTIYLYQPKGVSSMFT